jgi:type I restriction enzyme R subunit
MCKIGKPERETQNRVVALFQIALGYRYLGNWEERKINSNEKKFWTHSH